MSKSDDISFKTLTDNLKNIKTKIEAAKNPRDKLRILQDNFGYIVSAMLFLRKEGNAWSRIFAKTKPSGKFRTVDLKFFGGWLGKKSSKKVKEKKNVDKLKKKNCPAGKLLRLNPDDYYLTSNLTRVDLIKKKGDFDTLKKLYEESAEIFADYVPEGKVIKDIPTKNSKKAEKIRAKKENRINLCYDISQIFNNCRDNAQACFKLVEDCAKKRDEIDIIYASSGDNDIKKITKAILWGKNKKEAFEKLVETANKQNTTLKELVEKEKINYKPKSVYLFDTVNDIAEWAFALALITGEKIENAKEFFKTCKNKVPEGWVSSKQYNFISHNGKPIEGIVSKDALALEVFDMVDKYWGIEKVIVNADISFPGFVSAGKDCAIEANSFKWTSIIKKLVKKTKIKDLLGQKVNKLDFISAY